MRKEYGGSGVPNLRDLILCLLGSWLKRFLVDDGRLWKHVIDHKYRTNNPNIFTSKVNSFLSSSKGFVGHKSG